MHDLDTINRINEAVDQNDAEERVIPAGSDDYDTSGWPEINQEQINPGSKGRDHFEAMDN